MCQLLTAKRQIIDRRRRKQLANANCHLSRAISRRCPLVSRSLCRTEPCCMVGAIPPAIITSSPGVCLLSPLNWPVRASLHSIAQCRLTLSVRAQQTHSGPSLVVVSHNAGKSMSLLVTVHRVSHFGNLLSHKMSFNGYTFCDAL